LLAAQQSAVPENSPPQPEKSVSAMDERAMYAIGPEDQISIQVFDFEEIPEKTVRVDHDGFVDLPLIGRIQVGGMSISELQADLTSRLRKYIRDPRVSVNIVQYHSHPVSVLGAVNTPGTHQLQGPRRLMEILSLAGGLRQDAGVSVRITRQLRWGTLDVAGAQNDATGQFSVAEIPIASLLSAKNPAENIFVRPNDVIAVSVAEIVYVMGEVRKPGGFTLREKETISLLQALSLAEGLERTAAPKSARILRAGPTGVARIEIPVNISKILEGRAPDVPLQPNDILLVPVNVARGVLMKTAETALQIGTGVVIWRR
jgi:polysaccharide export outer membrane protein